MLAIGPKARSGCRVPRSTTLGWRTKSLLLDSSQLKTPIETLFAYVDSAPVEVTYVVVTAGSASVVV